MLIILGIHVCCDFENARTNKVISIEKYGAYYKAIGSVFFSSLITLD